MDEKEKLVSFSAKITQENRDRLDRIKDELGVPTSNELFDNLLDRFYSPIKVNRENAEAIGEQKKEIEQLKKLLGDRELETKELISKLNTELSAAQAELSELKNRKEITLSDLIPASASVLQLEPITVKVLEYVAAVEGKRRGQEWTPQHVIDFFVYSRFIRGDLNGNLNSVPDHVILKLEKELENE